MKIEIEISEEELTEKAKEIIIKDMANRMLNEFRGSSERYCYRTVIKECVREVIKKDIDNLSDRAIEAASRSITSKAVKKMSAEDLISILKEQ